MATAGSSHSPRRRSPLDALFGEAWELERRRRRRYVAAALLLCLAGGVVVAVTERPNSSPNAPAPAAAVGVRFVGASKVGGAPQALLADGGSLWIATQSHLVRVSQGGGAGLARIPIPPSDIGAGLTSAAGSIWMASTGTARLLRIDPATDRVIARIRVGGRSSGRTRTLGGGVAFADGRIWATRVSTGPRGDVVAVAPGTDKRVGTPITVGAGPDEITSAFGSLWVDNTSLIVGTGAPARVGPVVVSRIDPRTGRATATRFSGAPTKAFGSLWILQADPPSAGGTIVRVNPTTRRAIASIAIPRIVAICAGDGRLWAVAYPRSRSAARFLPIKDTAMLWQIDPTTDRPIGKPRRLSLSQPNAIVASHGQLWIADFASGQVVRFKLTAS